MLEQNFIQEWKLSQYVLTPMLMESPVKSPQTISGASQESGVVAFSSTTEGDEDLFFKELNK